MGVVLHWFLPTSGDSRTVVPFGPDGHQRPPTLDYLAQIARAADDLGYTGVLTPTGTWCEDSWLVTAALLRETKRLEVPRRVPTELDLADARRAEGRDVPADLGWTAAAQHRHRRRRHRAATVRRLARPRRALRPHGRVPVGAARRVERSALRLRGALLPCGGCDGEPERPNRSRSSTSAAPPMPPRWSPPSTSTCTSPGANRPTMVAPRLARMRELAAEHGRTLRFGIRLHVITPRPGQGRVGRDRALPRGISIRLSSTAAQAALAKSASVGQQRMVSLHGGSRDDLVDRTQPVGRHRARPRRRGHGARRQPRGGRRPHRGVPPARLRRVHPVRTPSPRGGLLVRRGRDANPASSWSPRAGRASVRRRRNSRRELGGHERR